MSRKFINALKILSLVFFILFINCSEPSPNKNDNGDNGDNGNGDETTNLSELPEAVGGMLTEEKYEKMPNREVTEDNLQEFMDLFRAAKGSEQYVSPQRGKDGRKGFSKRLRKERAARAVSGDFESDIFTIPDGQGGSIIWEWTYKWEETENTEIYELTETGTERYQSFDYSQSGNLFLGEAISSSFYEYWYEDETNWKEIFEGKAKGKIEFRGEFAGKIEYMFPYYKETWSSVVAYEGNKYEGEIIISSGGNKIKLLIDDWWDFLYLV